MLVYSRRLATSPQLLTSSLLVCRVWHGLPVLREGKWAAEYADIPAEVTAYPTGCSGSFYITTPGTAARTGDRLLARSRDK